VTLRWAITWPNRVVTKSKKRMNESFFTINKQEMLKV
jgi:hypothetical protein